MDADILDNDDVGWMYYIARLWLHDAGAEVLEYFREYTDVNCAAWE
jgi:hypothetical protein